MMLKLSKEELTELGFESIDEDPAPGLYVEGSICADKEIGNAGLFFSYSDVTYLDGGKWHSFTVCIKDKTYGNTLQVVKEISSKEQFYKLEDVLNHQ